MRVHLLHSSVPLASQRAALEQSTAGGPRKVVLATSIAETSITIPDASIVIDAGRTRVSAWDAASRVSALRTELASADAAAQRAGRVGRVGPGTVYRLYSRAAAARRAAAAEPEIVRSSLDGLFLQAQE
eukprot:CAMPEP_0202783950 /NCGR_PEP_ID=MMETSP1388-20130828/65428_1 /ASSEMBLY_ACC=CAM_ASM_000864 /TAXON_ID=37098 /ORGANISM="Isochrysis sp, Strain CCMP1244" /LENGTH=128 /DNA_ID=CAMNT_0049453431 /DNA_START=1 /DNA_END=384 /DNA_ORIENTATION=+